MSEVIPTKTIDIEKTFNIESKMNVKGFENSTDRVPEIDSSYRFSRETTLAILAGFQYNRRVIIQGYHHHHTMVVRDYIEISISNYINTIFNKSTWSVYITRT